MLANLSIIQFLEKTASASPVPGGGSVAALCAALAASLSEMVANLTIGKKNFASVEAEMQEIASAATGYRARLSEAIDKDSGAFDQVMAAFKLPKHTEEEKNKRKQAIQQALKSAALVPLDVAKDAFEIMGLAEKALIRGNKNAVTDATVSAMMARTAVLAALYNVKINLTSIEDPKFIAEVDSQVKELEGAVEIRERKIRQKVEL